MNNEFSADLITLIDEDNNEHTFEILDTLEYEDKEYYALYPVFDDAEESVEDSGEYYIMEVVEENGEEELAEVEDDELWISLLEIFEQRFEELFDDDETEE